MTIKDIEDAYYIGNSIEQLDEELLKLEEEIAADSSPDSVHSELLAARAIKIHEEKAELMHRQQEIQEFIGSMRKRDQLVIKYRYEDHLSWQEVAEILDNKKSLESIKRSLYRAIEQTSKLKAKSS